MRLVLLFAILQQLILSQDDVQGALVRRITSCWILQVQEASQSKPQLNLLIDQQIESASHNNRSKLFYKIQTDMIHSCVQVMTDEMANIIIDAIQEEQAEHKSYRQIVPEFKYEDYNVDTFDWEYTQDDQTLLKLIKELEVWVGDYIVTTETKPAKKESNIQELRKKLIEMKKGKDLLQPKGSQEEVNKFHKEIIKIQKNNEMKSTSNYIISGIVLVVLIIGGVFSYKLVSNSNSNLTQKKNKKSKQQ